MSGDEKTPWNPSRKAIERVKNPLPAPKTCPHCQSAVEIRHHDDIYGASFGEWPWMYACTGCETRVGMHPFTDIPLGTLATEAIRKARITCKVPFEALYKTGKMDRNEAYEKLAARLGIAKEACHFGWFDEAMCHKAAAAAREIYLECFNGRRR